VQCALDSTNKAIYQTTIGTFLVAFGVYGYECFVAKTVPFKHALPPFIVAGTPSFSTTTSAISAHLTISSSVFGPWLLVWAGTSLVWMLFFH
jgi:hypothetical protein